MHVWFSRRSAIAARIRPGTVERLEGDQAAPFAAIRHPVSLVGVVTRQIVDFVDTVVCHHVLDERALVRTEPAESLACFSSYAIL